VPETAAAPAVGAVGYAPIDELHLEFERLAARLAAGDDLPATLEALLEHIDRHFGLEERLMTETGFPMLGCHAREHAGVREVVVEVRRRHAAGETEFAARLAEALPQWFALHAGSMDAALAQFLRARAEPARRL
jgi:hemerythrin-like metal-binding protein